MNERDSFGSNGASGTPESNAGGEHLDEELLTAYRDRAVLGDAALDPVTCAAVDAHLLGCARCRETLRELEATVALLRELPQWAPRRTFILTPEMIETAGGSVRHQPRRRLAWVWPVRWVTAMVTLLFAITVGLDLGTAAPPAAPTTLAVPSNTATVVTAPLTAATPIPLVDPSQIGAFGLTPTIWPTPTATAAPAPIFGTMNPVNLRAAEIFLGVLASVLAFFGFALPPLLRRRATAA